MWRQRTEEARVKRNLTLKLRVFYEEEERQKERILMYLKELVNVPLRGDDPLIYIGSWTSTSPPGPGYTPL